MQARLCFVVQCVRAVPAVPPSSAAHLTTPRRSVAACTASSKSSASLAACPVPREQRERSTGTYLPYLALRTYGIRHFPYVTYFTLPRRRRFPRRLHHAALPRYCACLCQSTRPYRTACYWHGYTDQLPPRPLLTGRYGFGFGTPNGRISCPYARSSSCSAKSSSSSPSSSSSSSSSSSFSSSALP